MWSPGRATRLPLVGLETRRTFPQVLIGCWEQGDHKGRPYILLALPHLSVAANPQIRRFRRNVAIAAPLEAICIASGDAWLASLSAVMTSMPRHAPLRETVQTIRPLNPSRFSDRQSDAMEFHADLHVHSKYSRATSRDLDLEHLAWWAARKGVAVVGTGDCVHPAWLAEIKDKLKPAGNGLFALKPEIEAEIWKTLPASCRTAVRFMLSVEISTIYKKGERTRKIHHLIYVPDLDAADRLAASLGRIGNIASDGRPILGLDSRDLLELALASGPHSFLVPAHIWTPWFAALGSQSGFDSIRECYGDLADHIFAVETGLSSDPAMNWRVSSLDRYRLTSNSDAHSPGKLGREATRFSCEPDFFAIRRALETGEGYRGTVEFFPEEGKYHLDGHRACGVRLDPAETVAHEGRCPVCGNRVTLGVAHRVEMLADREEALPPPTAGAVTNLVPLPEILSEIVRRRRRLARRYARL